MGELAAPLLVIDHLTTGFDGRSGFVALGAPWLLVAFGAGALFIIQHAPVNDFNFRFAFAAFVTFVCHFNPRFQ
mgnify:CR=1 FL=1